MSQTYLQINPTDNLLVALQDLPKGTVIRHNGNEITLENVDVDISLIVNHAREAFEQLLEG